MKRSTAALLALGLLLAGAGATAGELCTVESCHDGDTCRLVCSGQRVKVRLYCVDAPELGQSHWGKRSRDYLRAQAPAGTVVELERVPGQRDRHSRTIGVLIREDGVNLNLDQVQSGWAAVYPEYCADPVYDLAQEDAVEQRRGIWRTAGAQQRPWEWRAKQRRRG